MSARDQILGKIKKHLKEKPSSYEVFSSSGDVFPKLQGSLTNHFIENLESIQGEVFTCINSDEIASQLSKVVNKEGWNNIFCIDSELHSLLKTGSIDFQKSLSNFLNMEVGITSCEFLIAQTGGVMVHSKLESGRKMNVFPPVHIIIANATQIIATPENALKRMRLKYTDTPSMISTITGPSRTADIEKTLIMGAHGPKRLIVFINLSK